MGNEWQEEESPRDRHYSNVLLAILIGMIGLATLIAHGHSAFIWIGCLSYLLAGTYIEMHAYQAANWRYGWKTILLWVPRLLYMTLVMERYLRTDNILYDYPHVYPAPERSFSADYKRKGRITGGDIVTWLVVGAIFIGGLAIVIYSK